ncbi:BrnT family toxin [Candidatus Roizmanbacteria bacterium]|nr:BrnT family toxin [Candidatus Roizmanbacteria bacterium]
MVEKREIAEFEWDESNIDKSYQKHGISPNEAEEIFLDENLLELEDLKHSQTEKRLVAIGFTSQKKLLFCAFTVRKNKIRIISVRPVSKKERRLYEKT